VFVGTVEIPSSRLAAAVLETGCPSQETSGCRARNLKGATQVNMSQLMEGSGSESCNLKIKDQRLINSHNPYISFREGWQRFLLPRARALTAEITKTSLLCLKFQHSSTQLSAVLSPVDLLRICSLED
jgi:hypothetical protein